MRFPASAGSRLGPADLDESAIAAAGVLHVTGITPALGPGPAAAVRAAVDAAPDLLIVLAGDGTARLAAELCGLDGPLVAPMAGGTLNMLPHAL